MKNDFKVRVPAWILSNIIVPLEELTKETELILLYELASKRLGIPQSAILELIVLRESIDARKKSAINIAYTLQVRTEARISGIPCSTIKPSELTCYDGAHDNYPIISLKNREHNARPVIVGAGPCGLFCALALAEYGMPAILLERGKPVEERQADVDSYWSGSSLQPESNVQFGEGGAGAFSDGKLTTRINDTRCEKVLAKLVECGAPVEIMKKTKPHVGTDLLMGIIKSMRKKLKAMGTEFLFSTRLDDIAIKDGTVKALKLSDGSMIFTDRVVLATGHSARDTFQKLLKLGLHMEAKPFSVGVRIEHLQSTINRAQYGDKSHFKLGSAEYQLFEKYGERTAYTFCMCPGGKVVAAASEPHSIVTNGMSYNSRDLLNANSAFVVSVTPQDFGTQPLDGIAFQRGLEQQAYILGGRSNAAPVQLLGDFISGGRSVKFGGIKPSYTGETKFARLDTALPPYITRSIRAAAQAFNRRISGFSEPDALLTGFETRTSSPVRILRDRSFQALGHKGIYPAGEGAGYAGGIMSAAADGLRVAEAIITEVEGR